MSNWETKILRHTARANGTCKACKTTYSRLVLTVTERSQRTDIFMKPHYRLVFEGDVDGVTKLADIVCCGQPVRAKPVKGNVVREIPCGAKCLGSKGHVCDCSCGGKNHGAGFSTGAVR